MAPTPWDADMAMVRAVIRALQRRMPPAAALTPAMAQTILDAITVLIRLEALYLREAKQAQCPRP